MKLTIRKPMADNSNAKCTIHQNGKLGFSQDAVKKMVVDENSYIEIFVNEDDKNDKNLYVKVTRENTGSGFSVKKAGQYFYLNTKNLFNELMIEYNRIKIMYDIVDFEHEGASMFKLIRREKERKNKKN